MTAAKALREAITAGWLRSPLLVALHSFPEGRHELEALAEKIWDAAVEVEHGEAYMQGHSEGHDAGFGDGVEHQRRADEKHAEVVAEASRNAFLDHGLRVIQGGMPKKRRPRGPRKATP